MSEYNHYLVDDRYLPEHVAEVRRLKDDLLVEEAKVRNLQAENQSLRKKLHARPDECTLTSVCWTETHDAWEAELEQVKAEAAAMRSALEGVLKRHSEREVEDSKPGKRMFWECPCDACETARKALSGEAGKTLLAEYKASKGRDSR